jgi:carbon monoxide dehydrogenase subunit G
LELNQRVIIPVAPDIVWQALNDHEMLKQCLGGCERFEPTAENQFEVVVLAKVGPVKAKFTGEVELLDVNPPISYRIQGSGKGGVAGFAKGGAAVQLAADEDGASTIMSYQVSASVGGKLAQIGSRLVTGAARKMADDFFRSFVRVLSGDEALEVTIETLEV